MNVDDTSPDNELTDEEAVRVAALSISELEQIDNALLAHAGPHHWLKVARIVGAVMTERPAHVTNVPDAFYAKRVATLVMQGKLESQGDLQRMRFCEVRIPD